MHDGDFASFSRLALPNPLIVDVGANSGQSIASFKHIFLDSRIESFEANPFFFPVLNVVKSWYSNVVVHNFGLGSEEGTLDFHVPIVDGKPILQEGSTRCDYFENNWVIERLGRYGRQLEFDVFPVEIRRGDQLLIDQPVDIVKIDVEGAELDVLSSMIGLIENSHPLFLVENSDYHNVTPFLLDLGYLCYQYFPECNELRPLEFECTNCIYVHPQHGRGLI